MNWYSEYMGANNYYQNQAEADEEEGPRGVDDDIVDADFEDLDDDKRA